MQGTPATTLPLVPPSPIHKRKYLLLLPVIRSLSFPEALSPVLLIALLSGFVCLVSPHWHYSQTIQAQQHCHSSPAFRFTSPDWKLPLLFSFAFREILQSTATTSPSLYILYLTATRLNYHEPSHGVTREEQQTASQPEYVPANA